MLLAHQGGAMCRFCMIGSLLSVLGRSLVIAFSPGRVKPFRLTAT